MPLRRAALVALLFILSASPARGVEADPPVVAPPPEVAQTGPADQPVSTGLESLLPRRCGVCHLDKAPSPAPGRITFTPPGPAAGAGDAGLCYSCHNGIVRDDRRSLWSGRHHPSSGRVSCGSCHTPHVKEANVGSFMRYPQGNYAFCATCHPGRRAGESGEHPAITAETGRGQGCGGCHMVHRAQGDGLIRTLSAEVLCGPCHGDNPSRPGKGPGMATHLIGKTGPSCLACHNIHRTSGSKLMLNRSTLEGSLCRRCHEKNVSERRAEANHPVAPGQAICLSCHRMHNAERTRKLRALLAVSISEVDAICRRCHADLAGAGATGDWNHPVGRSVAETEGVLAEKLGRRGAIFASAGRISCLTCHRSHGGRDGTPQLVASRETLCLHCHLEQNALARERARPGTHPIAVKPRLARIDASFIKAGGVTGPGGELICGTCHRTHHGPLVLPRASYSCLLCHPRQQSVSSTAHSTARAPGTAGISFAGGMCNGCHGDHGWRVDPGIIAKGWTVIEGLCMKCHLSATTNHPLGIAPPPDRGSAGLPLFWTDGRRLRRGGMSCATCHDVHSAGADGRFLRAGAAGDGRDSCVGCHAAAATVVGSRHDLSRTLGSTCGPCHSVHDKAGVASWPTARGGGKAADLADTCGACHQAGGPAAARVVAERFHPSGVPSAAPGGLVGCAGCHNPHRWNPEDANDRGTEAGAAGAKFLVRPVAGRSDLCAGCHDAQSAVAGTPHDLTKPGAQGSGVCAACHRVHGAQPLSVVAAPSRNPAEKPAPGVDHCAACHAPGKSAADLTVGEHGHPVGVSTGQDFGPDLPLYGNTGRRQLAGRIACATCHDAHVISPPDGSGTTSKAARSFLRMGADGYAPLCFPCHAEKATVIGTDHDLRVTAPAAVNRAGENAETSGVCGACHAVHGTGETWVMWNRGLGKGRDDGSRACTGCHRPGSETKARVPQREEAHLVNFPGRGLVSRLFTITRTVAAGAGSIPLFDMNGVRTDKGYLSCVSCHDVHRWQSDSIGSGPGTPNEGNVNNSFLRVRPGGLNRTLCVDCHKNSLTEHYKSYHSPPASQ